MSREQLAKAGITLESVKAMIEGGDYITKIAEEDGKAVAFCMAQVSEKYVFAVFVRPVHENKGYGRAALEATETGMRERGVYRACLCTGSDASLRSYGFYRHLGWRRVGLMPDGQAKFEKDLG